MQRTLSKLTQLAVALAFTLGVAATTQAADPTGTWVSTIAARREGGQSREMTFKLKLEADGKKVTGSVTTPGRGGGDPTETKIEDGKLDGATVSFSVTRTFQDNKFTTKYAGKISADGKAIEGTMESPGRGGGDPQKREWKATKKS